jgi:hypothetical protein
VVLSYFSDKQQEVIDFAILKGVPHSIADVNSTIRSDNSVLLMDAQWLISSPHAMDFLVQQSKTTPINFLFYGHYPIPQKENDLLSKIIMSFRSERRLKFFSSLDDRAFEMFNSGNIKSIVEKMGLKEDEFIEHAMVTKAMARAREKIASGVPREITAPTESVWYEKNCST